MTDLEKLIADSIEARNAKIAEAKAAQRAEEARYKALHRSKVAKTIEAVKPRVPAPLHPYIKYTGGEPEPVNRYALDKGTWSPNNLQIDAPGLAKISITFGEVYLPSGEEAVAVDGIIVSDAHFQPDQWQEAIAAAFDHYHNQRQGHSEAARGLD